MNMLRYVLFTALGIARGGITWTTNHVARTRALALVTVVVTLVPCVLGLLVGRLGLALGNSTVEGIGQGLISFSGLAGTVMLTVLYLRAVILVEALTNVSGVANTLTGGVTPALPKEEAEKFLGFLRGYSAWAIFIALYGQVVPLYRNLGLTAVVATIILFLAAAMGANWTDPAKYRARAVSAALLLWLMCSIGLVFPQGMADLRSSVGVKMDRLSFSSQSGTKVDAIALESDRQSAANNQQVLKDLLADKTRIERRAAELCQGRFCSKAEEAHYKALKDAIRDAKDGKYFERLSGLEKYEPSPWKRLKGVFGPENDGEKSATKPAAAGQPSATASQSVATAPPPSVPPLPPPPSAPRDNDVANLPPPNHNPHTAAPRRSHGRISTPAAHEDSFARMLGDMNKAYPDVN